MEQSAEIDRNELDAWNNGVKAARSAIPQLMAIADRTPGYQARFWDALLSGISGAGAAQIGFEHMRSIFQVAQQALDKTESDHLKNKSITH